MTIENSLPTSSEVREEFRRTSRRLRLLVELLSVCEKAEAERPPSRSASAEERLEQALAANSTRGIEVTE